MTTASVTSKGQITIPVAVCEAMHVRAEVVWKAVRVFRDSRADFADCLIACTATSFGCEHIMTFDRGAAKHAGTSLIGAL